MEMAHVLASAHRVIQEAEAKGFEHTAKAMKAVIEDLFATEAPKETEVAD